MHRSPGCIACSKSRRPPASPRSPTSPASPRRSRCTLFTTWHAQHHSTVDAAAQALAGKRIKSMEILLARGRPQMASGPAMDLGAGRVRRVRSRHQRLLDRDQDFPRRAVRAVRRAQRSRRMPRRRSPPRSIFSSPEADGPLTASLDWRRDAKARNGRSRSRPPTEPAVRLENGGATAAPRRPGARRTTGPANIPTSTASSST